MLTLSPAVRIYLATGATDLRRSIDGLSALVREQLALDPLSGHLSLSESTRRPSQNLGVGSLWLLDPVQTTGAGHVRVANRGVERSGRNAQWRSGAARGRHRCDAHAPPSVVRTRRVIASRSCTAGR